jgi:DNA-binding MarR family transcriptional regulator
MADKLEQIISLIFLMKQMSHENMLDEKNRNFSFLQFITLRYIKEKKPLMKELADFLAIKAPSATSLINTLSEADLVNRLAEAKDRRVVRIAVTKKGEKSLEKWQKKIAGNMRKRLEKLNKSEQESLAGILTKLTKISNN